MKSDKQFLFASKIEIDDNNEFKDLFERIKSLVDEINTYNLEVDKLQRENTFLQIQHARYQINPHLLYNSLSALKWECMKYDAGLPHTIDMLADYYILSLSSNEENYTFNDEIELIKKYINVISAIHKFNYKYSIKLEKSIYKQKTIQHIFQPFVENSILHGINRMENGFIKICGKRNNNRITIIIYDNGYGIPEKKFQIINNANDSDALPFGIGLKNTIRRIKLYYGENCVVKINSEENLGTTISIEFDIDNDTED